MTVREADKVLNVPDRPKGWKNLVFRRDGTSSYARRIWPTKQAAKASADDCDAEIWALYARGQLARILTQDGGILVDDYSHIEQVESP